MDCSPHTERHLTWDRRWAHSIVIPLASKHMQTSTESKIFDLVTQYADFLEKNWRLSPESIRWSKIETHLRRPTSL
jgi:hypothetical protein